MKKFLAILMMTLFVAPTFAQWTVGPRLGLNLSTCSGKYSEYDTEESHWIPGIVVGAVAERSFTDMISGVGEILFLTSGAKYTYTYEEEGYKSEECGYIERYGKIQIPILAKFTFGEDFQYYGSAGPYFGFTICGKYIDKEMDTKEKIPSNAYKAFDFGLYIGGGVQKQLGPGKLAFDLRFGLGLTDSYQFPDDQDKPNGYKPYKNRNISMTFAYMFEMDK
jgi:hypothetical protein